MSDNREREMKSKKMMDSLFAGFGGQGICCTKDLDEDLQAFLNPLNWNWQEVPIPREGEFRQEFDPVALSENPFALFVSDLHMSDAGRGDDFMLGHNNGPALATNPKTYPFAWLLVLAMLRARQVGARGVDLVLNGDTVDVWEMAARRTTFAHSQFYALIGNFARIPGNRAFYIPGNHDARFIPPPPPVIVAGAYWNPALGTYATHGHQFDSLNQAPLAPNCPGQAVAGANAKLEVDPGNWLVPGPFPFCLVDNIKPLTYDSVRAYFWRRAPRYFHWLFWIAKTVSPSISILRFLINLLGRYGPLAQENDRYLEDEARAISTGKAAPGLPAGTNPARVVFGHTHVPCARRPYFNTGTWGPLLSIHWPPTSNRHYSNAVETYVDLNPYLYIFADPATGIVSEEFYYYDILARFFPFGFPTLRTPADINALRRALYFD